MKVKKEITKHIDVDVMVDGITLLSVEEYEKHKRDIPSMSSSWWLRSRGIFDFDAALVTGYDAVYCCGYNVTDHELVVRPALKINPESSNLQIGDKILFRGYRWTVISAEYVLCDEGVTQMVFRRDWRADDANVWEASDVKKWLEEWLENWGEFN